MCATWEICTYRKCCMRLQFCNFSGMTALLTVLTDLKDGQERFLRNVDSPDALHPSLAFFLFFQQFALSGDVAAIAFGQDVLAHGGHALTCDDFSTDRRLDGNFKHLAGN